MSSYAVIDWDEKERRRPYDERLRIIYTMILHMLLVNSTGSSIGNPSMRRA